MIIAPTKFTGSLAIAEGPHNELFQLKCCQLLQSCTKSYILKACIT